MAEHQTKLQGVIKIHVKENVNLEQLHGLIAHIGGLAGCPTCGLLGIDLRLSGDPVELQQITKLPGVQSASFGE
jgi:hypothetical protein